MKNSTRQLIRCISIPVLTGALAAALTQNDMKEFELINKPPFTPPGIVFSIVWLILYVLMGIASYVVFKCRDNVKPLFVYGIQLAMNFCWSIFFFSFKAYMFSFVWLMVLLFFIIWTAVEFYKCNKYAGLLMVPYILWVCFAAYLNLGVYILNR